MVNATECVTVIMRRECTLGQKSHLFREKITLHPQAASADMAKKAKNMEDNGRCVG